MKSNGLESFLNTLLLQTQDIIETAEAELQKGIASLISFGTAFLANPDLPRRFEFNTTLNEADRNTMFGGDEKGYTDCPFLK